MQLFIYILDTGLGSMLAKLYRRTNVENNTPRSLQLLQLIRQTPHVVQLHKDVIMHSAMELEPIALRLATGRPLIISVTEFLCH